MGPVQPRFLNAVLELETALPPERLLAGLLAVEEAALRRRAVHWGPRTLDLDLLLHGDAIRSSPSLTLPHPGLAARRFVLAPLAELVPDLAVPGSGRTVSELLALAPPHDLIRVGRYPL
jgi:2-amino-4-hydroxy-6-hydroxymethyldihydropteridine diphosphokinase